jgi:hypothetical protein
MKRATILLLLIFNLSFIKPSNNSFYWYYDQKISIEVDDSKIFLMYNNSESLVEIEKYLNINSSKISVEKTPYKAVKIHFKSDQFDKNWLKDLVQKHPDISFTKSFNYDGESNYIFELGTC